MTAVQVQAAFDNCIKQQKAGRFPAAIAGFQAILQSDANHFRAWHLLGVAYLQSGQLPQAIDALRRAIALHGTNAAFHNNLGVALLAQGDLAGAKDAFTAASALQADYADAIANLGLVASKAGNAGEAARCFREALRLQPKHLDALYNWANLLFEEGQIEDAIRHYQQAAAAAETRCDILNNLGRALLEKGSVAEAGDCFARALALDPNFGEAAFNAGKVHAQMERTQDAARAFQSAAQMRSHKPIWRLQHLGLCPTIFQSEAELDEYRADLERRLDEALQMPLRLDLDEFAADGFVPSFNLAHHGRSNRRLLEKFAALFTPHIPRREPTPSKGKTRVGFLLTAPHVANFLRTNAGIVEHLDAERFDVTLFCTPGGMAELRKGIRRADLRFVPFSQRFSEAVHTIAAAGCDVIYFHKVGTDPLGYLLPFARLAPVQCTGWATHFTSGVPEVDYYLSSKLVEGDDAQDEYVERLIRFETLPRYEKAAAAIPAATRGDFGLPAQGSLYLCPQRLAKFHPAQDELLRQVLDEDSTGTLVLLAGKKPLVLEQLRSRFRKTLGAAAERLVFLPPQSSLQLRQLMSVCDALLDIHHYSVSLMARDAFAANLPIVTLPGQLKVERYALGFYRKVGIDDLIATTSSDYVRLAVRLGKDRDYCRSIQQRIAASRDVLFEDRQCVMEFERFLTTVVGSR